MVHMYVSTLNIQGTNKKISSIAKFYWTRVHSVNVCLSTEKSPMRVKFEVMDSPAISGMLDEKGESARSLGRSKFKNAPVRTVVDVQCLPIFTLLAALDFPTVDFFSLDVEGAELDILQTIPWHKVNIVLNLVRS